jgi:5-methylcytosine-specific restriction endonuclease McrA
VPWDSARKDPAYNTAAWRRARNAAMKRAQWKCEIRLDCCIGAATQVDHVAGLDNDRNHQNLRAACAPCHAKVTARQGNDARRGRGRAPRDPAPTPRTAW